MKVAFDENVPMMMVRVFQTLATHGDSLDAEIVTAKSYSKAGEYSDIPWVQRFGGDGGEVIVSGDTRLRSRVHERAALAEAGVVTYFFERKWSGLGFFSKSAMLLHWWPSIRKHMDGAVKGTCWEIPFTWNSAELRDVSARDKSSKTQFKIVAGGKT